MVELKVYLRPGNLPLYKELINFPPEGVKYDIASKLSSANDSGFKKSLKRAVWFNLTKFRPPAITMPSNKRLIHSCYGAMVSNNVPWVVDVEHYASFANYHIKSLNNTAYKGQIEKLLSSDCCRKIMPWTLAAKNSIKSFFRDERINRKMEVVYPAIHEREVPKKADDTLRLLVVNRYFLEKGGLHAVRMFDALEKKYDIEMDVVSNAPKEITKKYEGNRKIKYFEPNIGTEDRVLSA